MNGFHFFACLSFSFTSLILIGITLVKTAPLFQKEKQLRKINSECGDQ